MPFVQLDLSLFRTLDYTTIRTSVFAAEDRITGEAELDSAGLGDVAKSYGITCPETLSDAPRCTPSATPGSFAAHQALFANNLRKNLPPQLHMKNSRSAPAGLAESAANPRPPSGWSAPAHCRSESAPVVPTRLRSRPALGPFFVGQSSYPLLAPDTPKYRHPALSPASNDCKPLGQAQHPASSSQLPESLAACPCLGRSARLSSAESSVQRERSVAICRTSHVLRSAATTHPIADIKCAAFSRANATNFVHRGSPVICFHAAFNAHLQSSRLHCAC